MRKLVVVVWLLGLIPYIVFAENFREFSIIQLPDEQYQTNCPGVLAQAVDCIIAGIATNNTKMVVMPGDLADNPTIDDQYITITNAMARLRASGLSVFAVPGNHDYIGRQWEKYVTPLLLTDPALAETWTNGRTWGGVVFTQDTAGLRLVYIGVPSVAYAIPSRLDWMKAMAWKYSDRLAIFVIHGYLDGDGTIPLPSSGNYLGGDIFATNVLACPNAIQVLCGHAPLAPGLIGASARHASIGTYGNIVQALLFDFQWAPPLIGQVRLPVAGNFCGASWIRMYRWRPLENFIQASTWDCYGRTNRVTPDCQFGIPIRSVVQAPSKEQGAASL